MKKATETRGELSTALKHKTIENVEVTRGTESDNLLLTLRDPNGKMSRVRLNVGGIYADLWWEHVRKGA